MSIEQGQIFDFDFGPRKDPRIEGPHAVVILQTDLLNQIPAYTLTLVAAITSKERKSPTYVPLEPTVQSGLSKKSYVKCDQIYTVPQAELGVLKGRIQSAELWAVKQALKTVFDLT